MTLADGFPPFYPERPSSVIFELNQVYLGYAAAALFVGLLLILPGVRGKDRMFFLLRWTTILLIGVSIIACVQGISWHEAMVSTDLPYSGSGQEKVRFEVGLKIGLASFNVTLTNKMNSGNDVDLLTFSEQFQFLSSDEELEKGLMAGLPFPILNILEHFSVKRVSSQWLWGRRYWIAGHYSLYMLWSAFATWVITNILLHTVLRYGGLMMTFTGLLMLGANASFTTIQSHGCQLEIHIGYYNPAVLIPTYGWCFWLCLAVGALCVVCGLIIFISDRTCSKSLRRFFNLQKENDFDLNDVNVEKPSRYSVSRQSLISVGQVNSSFMNSDVPGPSPSRKISSISTMEFEVNQQIPGKAKPILNDILEVDVVSNDMVDDVFTADQNQTKV